MKCYRGRDRSSLRASTGRHKNVITAIDPTYNEQTLQTYVPVADSQEAGTVLSHKVDHMAIQCCN